MVFIALVVLAGVAILYACAIGSMALRRSWQAEAENPLALWLLGLNLCEPLINTPLVASLSTGNNAPHDFAGGLLGTLPMLVLLIPVIGISSRATRRISVTLVLLGSARWILTVAALVNVYIEPHSLEHILRWFYVSAIVLIATTVWGQRKLKQLS